MAGPSWCFLAGGELRTNAVVRLGRVSRTQRGLSGMQKEVGVKGRQVAAGEAGQRSKGPTQSRNSWCLSEVSRKLDFGRAVEEGTGIKLSIW